MVWCELRIKGKESILRAVTQAASTASHTCGFRVREKQNTQTANEPICRLVYELNPADGSGGMLETFEPQHWSHSLFDSAVILLTHVGHRAVCPLRRAGGNAFSSCNMATASYEAAYPSNLIF